MPKTKQQFEEMKRASVENINITALKLFAQRGLAATNISNVAAAAGISTGLMYHYYASKEELYCIGQGSRRGSERQRATRSFAH